MIIYISIIRLIDSSLQADSNETNFVFWSIYHHRVKITCYGVKSAKITLDRVGSIDKKVNIRAQYYHNRVE